MRSNALFPELSVVTIAWGDREILANADAILPQWRNSSAGIALGLPLLGKSAGVLPLLVRGFEHPIRHENVSELCQLTHKDIFI
jgi:hypothetical protein